jgi:hypothetical protein
MPKPISGNLPAKKTGLMSFAGPGILLSETGRPEIQPGRKIQPHFEL